MKLLTKRALLLLALALACALLLGWAPGAAAAGGSSFEEEDEDESDKTDVAIDLSIKAYEVRSCGLVAVCGESLEGRTGGPKDCMPTACVRRTTPSTRTHTQAAMASRDVWVIDYFQEDCAPCMQIKTFMEQLAKDVHRTSSTNNTKKKSPVCARALCVCLSVTPSLVTNPIHPPLFPPIPGSLRRQGGRLRHEAVQAGPEARHRRGARQAARAQGPSL